MKKLFLIVLAASLGLAACGRDKGSSGIHQAFSLGTPACNGGDVCQRGM